MERSLNDFVWFDQRFIMENGKVDENNWLEYLQLYPEFDKNCINNQMGLDSKFTLKEIKVFGRTGTFYECRKVNNVLTIYKYEIQKQGVTLITLYYKMKRKKVCI